MSLFKFGNFKLHSGLESNWIIDCNELTDDDLICLAHIGRSLVGPFGTVIGIPNGGTRFAKTLGALYSTIGPTLIVDDVYTTGKSMDERYTGSEKGLVIFMRGLFRTWVTPIFQLTGHVT